MDSLVDPRAETDESHAARDSAIIDGLQHELDRIEQVVLEASARSLGEQARRIDEQAIHLTGRARPLPKRTRTMPNEPDLSTPPRKLARQRHTELAESLVIDPVMWAEAFKATWSVGADVDQLAGWFRDAMAVAIAAAQLDQRGKLDRFPNRYQVPRLVSQNDEAMTVDFGSRTPVPLVDLGRSGGMYELDGPAGEPGIYRYVRQAPEPVRWRDETGTCKACGTPAECEHVDGCPALDGHAPPVTPESYGIDSPDGRG